MESLAASRRPETHELHDALGLGVPLAKVLRLDGIHDVTDGHAPRPRRMQHLQSAALDGTRLQPPLLALYAGGTRWHPTVRFK